MDLPPNGGCGAAHSSVQGGLQDGASGVFLLLVLPSERRAVQGIQNVPLAARGCRMHMVNYMAKHPMVFFNKERRKTGGDLRDEAV